MWQMTVDRRDRRILGGYRIQVGSIVPVRRGHDLESTTGCSETGHLNLPFRSFARHVYGPGCVSLVGLVCYKPAVRF
ncbi:uncharacterized protein LACBIDRAFT_299628 [Laccaria bicolor S238N-H82]|uniref:Predicted protein n=1 Tax=Laccaria bicolor (strain S238N-H82 / ATCC MYA-4686) TaxID=486041 RepID=B0DF11_LACBS|nr:uncharacterized protein LACBIDRAFT_299628 [Laccaria bicolor S238N-H82]EDR06768.1 predicted protein [Laccaria bicolor S238N-H82]|eukprot:XP_001882615.1 predicted protein [Laccaria bicolor S238N-H82]